MSIKLIPDVWSWISDSLDVGIQHDMPARVVSNNADLQLYEKNIPEKVRQLTGLALSLHNWINITPDEQERSVCADIKEVIEVLRLLALSSVTLLVARYNRTIDRDAVDWGEMEFAHDSNNAINHCCATWDAISKNDHFDLYAAIMHDESARLVNQGISPLVEAGQTSWRAHVFTTEIK